MNFELMIDDDDDVELEYLRSLEAGVKIECLRMRRSIGGDF